MFIFLSPTLDERDNTHTAINYVWPKHTYFNCFTDIDTQNIALTLSKAIYEQYIVLGIYFR